MKKMWIGIILLLALATASQAATVLKSGLDGADFDSAGSWDNGAPSSTNPGTVNVDAINLARATANWGGGWTIDHTAGDLQFDGGWNVNNTGTYNLSGGSIQVTGTGGGDDQRFQANDIDFNISGGSLSATLSIGMNNSGLINFLAGSGSVTSATINFTNGTMNFVTGWTGSITIGDLDAADWETMLATTLAGSTFDGVDITTANFADNFTVTGNTLTLAEETAEATGPSPTDDAIYVNPEVVLEWTAGSLAVSHEVFFARAGNALVSQGIQAGNTFDPADPNTSNDVLEIDQEYIWRVDGFTEAGGGGTKYTGEEWSFTTVADVNQTNTILWFKEPATTFTESLVLGNGRIGAMVFGDANEERIILSEESIWSGSSIENNISGGYTYLPEIRSLLGQEKYSDAAALVKLAFPVIGAPEYAKRISTFGRFQMLGDLHLEFFGNNDPVENYRRELDIASALGTVTYDRGEESFTREHFVSEPNDVFVSRLTGPVSFRISMDRPERFTTTAVSSNELLMTGALNDGYGDDGLTYVGRLRVVAQGGSVAADGNELVVTDADEVLLLFAAATDYRGIAGRQLSDPLSATITDLDKAETKTFAQLHALQKADHEQWFNRVSLELPTTDNSYLSTPERLNSYVNDSNDSSLAALVFNFGRYLLISSSRPGGLPANLQGIWAEKIHIMWNGDYHININTQMNYWPALVCNLAELQEPLNNFIESLVEPGEETAQAYYDSNGWITHRVNNIWGYTAPTGLDMGGAAWLCEHLWEQYAFTQDADFLSWAYPIMKGSVEFYLDNIWPEPEHQWLVTGPSQSPENGYEYPNGGTGGLSMGPTCDMQQLRELFGNTARAAEILDVNEDLQTELIAKRPQLAPNQIAPDGALQEWIKPYVEREPTHRHCSPLYGLYPYYEITPGATPEMAQAAQRLLERRGVGQSTAWSNAWKVNLWARLGNAGNSWDFVDRMLYENSYDNLLSKFRPYSTSLFMIEANLGLTAGIAEMLLQSNPDNGDINEPPLINLLPALPDAWPDGKITGLRARGGFEVDMEWENGKLVECRILSLHGNPCKVRYGFQTEDLDLEAGEEIWLEIATAVTWAGGAGDDYWDSADNWIGDVAPVTGDSVALGTTGDIRLDSAFTIENSQSLTATGTGSNPELCLGTSSCVLTLATGGTMDIAFMRSRFTSGGQFIIEAGASLDTDIYGLGSISGNIKYIANAAGVTTWHNSGTSAGQFQIGSDNLTVDLTNYNIANSTTLILVDYETGALTGTFASVTLTDGWSGKIDYAYDQGGGDMAIAITDLKVPGDFVAPNGVDFADFAIFASAWQSSEGDSNWNEICNLAEPGNVIDVADLAVFCENWLTGI